MHVHLDLVGGIAGDMFLAAALDAGAIDLQPLTEALRTLGLGDEITIEIEHARRGAIAGTHVRFANWDPSADSDHRHLSTINDMIAKSGLPQNVKDRATALFADLGASEAKIHDIPIERVHFHEVGAVDSILDFVSAAWVIEHLDATWSCGEVPSGRGTIETAHGQIPVPAPATADLLRGMPIIQRAVDGELVTPTGAAILKGLAPAFEQRAGVVQTIGYGLGTKDFDGISNVLRMMVFGGATSDATSDFDVDEVIRLETEIDDMNPETLAAVANEDLPAAGAIDVVRVPVQMKKGRSGTRLTVLCRPDDEIAIARLLFERTTTFGVRTERVRRWKLHRKHRTVDTKYGEVRVKIGLIGESVESQTPEYEDCAEAARTHDVSVDRVWRAALAATEAADE